MVDLVKPLLYKDIKAFEDLVLKLEGVSDTLQHSDIGFVNYAAINSVMNDLSNLTIELKNTYRMNSLLMHRMHRKAK